jgi:cytosine/adenosine deaminase-related metal-dependent hydrolase
MMEKGATAMENTPNRLVITDATVVTMDAQSRILTPGVITVEDGKIAGVFANDEYRKLYGEVPPDGGSQRVIHAPDMIAIPGLINTHTHVSEILLRGGISTDRDLYDWQWNVTYPGLRAYEPDDAYIAGVLYSIDALKTGTTTFIDNSNTTFSLELLKASLRAYEHTGVRAVLAPIFSVGPLRDPTFRTPSRIFRNKTAHRVCQGVGAGVGALR